MASLPPYIITAWRLCLCVVFSQGGWGFLDLEKSDEGEDEDEASSEGFDPGSDADGDDDESSEDMSEEVMGIYGVLLASFLS